MARLGGMSSESFSSARGRLSAASVGLGSILREQRGIPGAARVNLLLGLSSQTTIPASVRNVRNSPVHSLASSPVESNGFLDVDDPEQRDDDIWQTEACEGAPKMHQHSLRVHLHELGSTHAYTSTLSNRNYSPNQRHGSSRMHPTAQKHCMQSAAMDTTQPAHHLVVEKLLGLDDARPTNDCGQGWVSPLSQISASQPVHLSHASQNVTRSQSIPWQANRNHTIHDCSQSVEHQSAPMDVPNWPKIMQKDAPTVRVVNFHSIEEVGEDDDEERLPPHEMLKREYARTQRMTSSVCEGQGRTLKGRDMRRVRNAVWRQTGFAD